MICNMVILKNIWSEYVFFCKIVIFFIIVLLIGKLKWMIEKKNILGLDVLILIIFLLLIVCFNVIISSFI